jgi:ADP-heptose:LPS heptosyltransferase
MFFGSGRKGKKYLKVVITGGLGDCLLATPFLRHFRKYGKFDGIICAIPTQALEIFDHNPNIDQLIPCSGRDLLLWGAPEIDCDVFVPYMKILPPGKVGADMTVSATPLFRLNMKPEPAIRQVAEYHGLKLDHEKMEIWTTQADKEWALEYSSRWEGKKVILINTASHYVQKTLPQSLARKIIDLLSKDFIIIAFPQNKPSLPMIETLKVLPGIRKSAELFKRLYCVISVDSFPSHLATAVGVPAVVLFGPSNPSTFGHLQNINIRTSSCPPCADTPRRTLCKRSRCLEKISAEQVAEAVYSAGRDY